MQPWFLTTYVHWDDPPKSPQEECDEGLSFTLVRRTGMHYLSLASRETHGFFPLEADGFIYFFVDVVKKLASFPRIKAFFLVQ